ncbi:MAG: hypothetical protein IPI30_04560 [Saprospiraceae bacterium]|nr:hypothetical protein [Candidatus Vicinibacter affinis]
MTRGKKAFLTTMIILNTIVLLGQIYPEGAPPFARIVNIIFLLVSLIYFFTQTRLKNS